MTDIGTMWWCPTCKQRIPQPRWMNMRKPNQRSYHLVGLRDHTIEKVPVIEGLVVGVQGAGLYVAEEKT